MEKMKILELECGTKSFTKVAEARGHKCFTVDIDKKFNPDLCIDIMDFTIDMLPKEFRNPDIIWASPPCIQYSHAKRSGIRDIEGSNKIVSKNIDIIEQLNPKYYFLENPQTGLLKFQPILNEFPFYHRPYIDVSYCKYGFPYRKQTRIWTNCNVWKSRPICRKDCKFMKDGKHIVSVGNGRSKYTSKIMKKEDKYKIPPELCLEIIEAIEKWGIFAPNLKRF